MYFPGNRLVFHVIWRVPLRGWYCRAIKEMDYAWGGTKHKELLRGRIGADKLYAGDGRAFDVYYARNLWESSCRRAGGGGDGTAEK